MKTIAACTFALGLASIAVMAGADKPATLTPDRPASRSAGSGSETNRPSTPRVVYTPPRVGAPRITTGPATRGDKPDAAWLGVLAPDHIAQTLRAQPSLYWYQIPPHSMQIEFALVTPGQSDPILQIIHTNSPPGRIQRVNLAAHGVSLEPHREYRWSVAAIRDPAERSRDIVALGAIRRTTPVPGLDRQLDGAAPVERAQLLAKSGYWYDALQTLLDCEPGTEPGRQARQEAAWLLSATGFTNAAAACIEFEFGP